MKNKVLNGFYENLLLDIGIVDVNKDGLLSYMRGENDSVNLTLEGKRLALPTRDNLKSGGDNLIMFHPASEQLMSGPSPVLDALREYIMLRLSNTSQAIVGAAMAIAEDPKLQKKVKGAGNELMRPLTTVDDKLKDTLDKVFDNTGMGPENRIYNIFLQASGSKENPRGLRTSKVSHPIMDDAFNDDPTTFFGVKMPRKTRDKPAIVGVLSVLLDITETEGQIKEYTSTVRQAPYFHSLLTAFMEIAQHQNRYLKSLKSAQPALKDLEYNLGWKDEFEDFENFVKLVGHSAPLLPGNAGKKLVEDDDESEEDVDVKPTGRSWKDIRDQLPEDEPVAEPTRERSRKPTASASGWKSLLKASREEDAREGISFGRDRGRNRRGGFDRLGDRDRDYDRRDRRGRDYGRQPDYKARSWRDIYN